MIINIIRTISSLQFNTCVSNEECHSLNLSAEGRYLLMNYNKSYQ